MLWFLWGYSRMVILHSFASTHYSLWHGTFGQWLSRSAAPALWWCFILAINMWLKRRCWGWLPTERVALTFVAICLLEHIKINVIGVLFYQWNVAILQYQIRQLFWFEVVCVYRTREMMIKYKPINVQRVNFSNLIWHAIANRHTTLFHLWAGGMDMRHFSEGQCLLWTVFFNSELNWTELGFHSE